MSLDKLDRTHFSLGELSERELEVLQLASIGSTNSEIAAELGLSTHAIKFHLASVYRKLGVVNRTEAAVLFVSAARQGALEGLS